MKIDEVATQYQVSNSTLRYYENEDLLGPVNRVNGIREFKESDLEQLDFIICLKRCGMTISQMKSFMALYQKGDSTATERLTILQKQLQTSRDNLNKLEQSIEHLETKINDVKALV